MTTLSRGTKRMPGLLGAMVVGLVIGCRSPETAGAAVGSLTISGAFAFQPATPDEAAVYCRIRNTGDAPDTLVRVSADLASGVMIHGHASEEGPTGPMPRREFLVVPAHGEVVLEPGHLHLMLLQLTRMPRAGDHFNLTLGFRRAGAVTFPVPVRPYAQ